MRTMSLSLIAALLLATGCAAQSPGTPADAAAPRPDAALTPAASLPATPAAPITKDAAIAPPSAATGIETESAFDPANPDRSCKTDADCAVKDVGNCCGAYPMCVNKNASTDPAAVQAQCAKDGMASICGFREVRGCSCVEGACQDVTDGEVVM
ncbi:MAG: hypothetical protein E6Q88_12310 [Lysobacteraceae bacterium]|nr:MAG: hypothetical protein E6Q88_12310 [Xanthomonadaceae bacterium]